MEVAVGNDAAANAEGGRDADLLQRLADAMADPFRARLLAAVTERPGISVREITGWVGGTDRKVRYHMEALAEAGLVEVQGEVRRRGALERQYRSTTPNVVGDLGGQHLEGAQERRISLEVLKMVMGDATTSVAAGRFGTREGHCETRIRGELDSQGWEDLAALFLRSTEEAQEVIRRSVERRRETGDRGTEVTAALLLFEAPIWNRDH
jgi:DNA-binding transcriptional ArsR family regulator